ncbi:MAG TPA: methyltransferase domain-containing protein [Stellaceae bacterium]|nr:methyltransferase domain-containing protein [Stellaceae bacterium]
MAEPQIRFEDGGSYESYMGPWSRQVGEVFLDWLAPPPGLRWLDIGCGTGVFTELLATRCAPVEIQAIDPAAAQLAVAQARGLGPAVHFQQGNAMALPFPDNRFDAATMALVIFFVPEPAKALAEMARALAPGGIVAAYVWDVTGAGLPAEPIHAEMRAMGIRHPRPPSFEISRAEALSALWAGAGLEAVEARPIDAARTFADFDTFWSIHLAAPNIRPIVTEMPAADLEQLKRRVRARLSNPPGPVTLSARANAIKGRLSL